MKVKKRGKRTKGKKKRQFKSKFEDLKLML